MTRFPLPVALALAGLALSCLVLFASFAFVDSAARNAATGTAAATAVAWSTLIFVTLRGTALVAPRARTVREDGDALVQAAVAEIGNQLAAAHEELCRAESLTAEAAGGLIAALNGVVQHVQRQAALASRAVHASIVPLGAEIYAGSDADSPTGGEDSAAIADDLRCTARAARAQVDHAVTLMQFQDVTAQLIAHVRRRLSSVGAMVDGLGGLPIDATRGAREHPQAGGARDAQRALRDELHEARKLTGPCPGQSDLRAGSVEVF